MQLLQNLSHFDRSLFRHIVAFIHPPETLLPLFEATGAHVVRIDPEAVSCSRSDVIEALKADNIGTSVHFIPVHHHKFYQDRLGCTREDYPNASRLYESSISLPLFPTMTDGDVEGVARSLTRIVSEHAR